jgi:hypothetical protein
MRALLSAAGSPLVAGSTPGADMSTKNVKVTKGFYIGGKLQEIGAVVAVPEALARDLVYRQKGEITDEAVRTGPKKGGGN